MSDLRLSVSKTKTYLGCKKQFHFNYILKLPQKERDFHVFGKFCHMALELFHDAYINGSQEPFHVEMGKAYKASIEEYKDRMTPEMVKECKTILMQYLKIINTEKDSYLAAPVLDCEKNFKVDITDTLSLTGMIDRIQLDKDNVLHLADYKTSKSDKYLKDDWFQLETYAYVMLMENPDLEKIRLSYIMLRHNFKYLTKDIYPNDIMKIKDKYIEYAKQILNEKEYPANPTVLCKFCSYLENCEEGRQDVYKNSFGETKW